MDSLTDAEVKEVGLGVLAELDRVCREHGLTYFLAYGTLIGALRHEGFIPWDDDVDVLMPRADYEALYRLGREGALGERFALASYRDRTSIYPFFKMIDTRTHAEESFIHEKHRLGVWVDIFPLERVSMSDPRLKRAKRRAAHQLRLRGLAACDPRFATSSRARIVKRVIHPVTRRLDPYAIARRADENARAVCLPDSAPDTADTRYALLVDDSMERNTFTPDVLFPASRAAFEGRQFAVPARAAEVLADYYGDWRRIPPPEERPPAHLRSVTWVGRA